MMPQTKRDRDADRSVDDPHEHWKEIEEFPDYSVSDRGRVRNNHTGRILAETENQDGVVKVGMSRDGKQYARSVALLVAQNFLEKPPGNLARIFDTPINVDGNRHNNSVDNLMWRPRWFAVKYNKQFKEGARRGFKVPIQVLSTGEIFPNSMAAATRYGILAEDTVISVIQNTYTFPTYQKFKVLDGYDQYADQRGE